MRFGDVVDPLSFHESRLQPHGEQEQGGVHVLPADGEGGMLAEYLLVVFHDRRTLECKVFRRDLHA